MFKFNPIKQALFEGFFQRIVSIEGGGGGDGTHPDYMKIPMFVMRDVDVDRLQRGDGWLVGLANPYPQQQTFEFYCDRGYETLVTGTEVLPASPSSSTFEIEVTYTLPLPAGSDLWFSVVPEDLTAVAWVEYMPALVDDGAGNTVEAEKSRIPVLIAMRDIFVDTPELNKTTGKLTMSFWTNRFNEDDYTYPLIQGIKIHWAVMAPYVTASRIQNGVVVSSFTRVDVDDFICEMSPPVEVMDAGGIPRMEHGGAHGWLATLPRTKEFLPVRTHYKGHALLGIYDYGDHGGLTSVLAYGSCYRRTDPNQYQVLPPKMNPLNGSIGGSTTMVVNAYWSGDLRCETALRWYTYSMSIAAGTTDRNYDLNTAYMLASHNVTDRPKGFTFTGLPTNEQALTYVPHEKTTQETIYSNRYTIDIGLESPDLPMDPKLELRTTSTHYVATYSIQGVVMQTFNWEIKDTPESLAVYTVDQFLTEVYTRRTTVKNGEPYEIGKVKGVLVPHTIDTSNHPNYPTFSAPDFVFSQSFRYIAGDPVIPTKPPKPIVYSGIGDVINPSWTEWY